MNILELLRRLPVGFVEAGGVPWSFAANGYIPVRLTGTGAAAGSTNSNGYVSATEIAIAGLIAWKDYIPVYVDDTKTVPFSFNANGYIPLPDTLTGGTPPLSAIASDQLMLQVHAEGPNGFSWFYDSSAFDSDVAATHGLFATPAVITTATKKFGAASASLGGAAFPKCVYSQMGDRLDARGTADMGFRGWWYPTANALGLCFLFDFRTAVTTNPAVYQDATNLYYFVNGANRITATALALNTWHFVEWSRVSGVSRLFVNGTQVGSNYADTIDFNGNVEVCVGSSYTAGLDTDACLVDEFCVFKNGGSTANYVAPTTVFADTFTVTSKWNSADKAATVSLINDDRVAYASANFGAVRGTTSRTTGVRQFECTFSGDMEVLVGIAAAGADLTDYPGAVATSWGMYSTNGNKYNNNVGAAYGAAYDNTYVIGVVYDGDAGTLTFYRNGVSQGTAYSSLSGAMYPCFGSGNNTAGNRNCKINTGQTPFRYAIGGATAWG